MRFIKLLIMGLMCFALFLGVKTCSHNPTTQSLYNKIDNALYVEQKEPSEITPADLYWKTIQGPNGPYQVFTYESDSGYMDFGLVFYCDNHKAWESYLIIQGNNFIPIGMFKLEAEAKKHIENTAWKIYNKMKEAEQRQL